MGASGQKAPAPAAPELFGLIYQAEEPIQAEEVELSHFDFISHTTV